MELVEKGVGRVLQARAASERTMSLRRADGLPVSLVDLAELGAGRESGYQFIPAGVDKLN